VHLEEITVNNIFERVEHIVKHDYNPYFIPYICDPRLHLKEAKAKSHIETLVAYDQVAELAR
jgi:hypothetical protein